MPPSPEDAKVYRQLSEDMRTGLKNIYKRISIVAQDDAQQTDALFTEASAQLKEVVKATEAAAMNIMEIVEKQLEQQQKTEMLLLKLKDRLGPGPELEELAKINASLGADLASLFTALSFQDITGQRIKKVVEALQGIEASVVELYLSSGLIMEGAQKDPGKDADTLRNEAQQAVDQFRSTPSKLKGPDSNGASQAAIDDMLAQLGL